MPSSSAPDTRGFEFPGNFEVTVFGNAIPELETIVLSELTEAGVIPDKSSIRYRKSSAANYLAITLSFYCLDRNQHQAAYARLRSNPAIKWTL